jgi:phosphoglycerate dehydrogenase-like enzyme
VPPVVALTTASMTDRNNDVVRSLEERGFEVRVHPHVRPPSREEQRALLAGAAGIIAGSEPIDRDAMAAAAHLRVISRCGIGFDAVDLDAATDLGIVVTYVPDAMVDAVADATLGLLLATARRICHLDRGLKAGGWPREMSLDVGGRTLGLVGTGRIGMAVARRARAFRMRLLGCDPAPNPLFVEELGGDYVPLAELLETADFVSLHLPASSATRGLIDAAALARMKQGAVLVNTARGALVDEHALLEALDAGRLAGAGLDVFSTEPPDPGSAAETLTRHPLVVATPHVASFTPVTVARMARAAMDNLLAVLAGERPQYVANPRVYDTSLRQVAAGAS